MAVVPDISVWTLLWCVVMTDYIIKFLTVMSKSVLAMFQPCCKNYRRRVSWVFGVSGSSVCLSVALTLALMLFQNSLF